MMSSRLCLNSFLSASLRNSSFALSSRSFANVAMKSIPKVTVKPTPSVTVSTMKERYENAVATNDIDGFTSTLRLNDQNTHVKMASTNVLSHITYFLQSPLSAKVPSLEWMIHMSRLGFKPSVGGTSSDVYAALMNHHNDRNIPISPLKSVEFIQHLFPYKFGQHCFIVESEASKEPNANDLLLREIVFDQIGKAITFCDNKFKLYDLLTALIKVNVHWSMLKPEDQGTLINKIISAYEENDLGRDIGLFGLLKDLKYKVGKNTLAINFILTKSSFILVKLQGKLLDNKEATEVDFDRIVNVLGHLHSFGFLKKDLPPSLESTVSRLFTSLAAHKFVARNNSRKQKFMMTVNNLLDSKEDYEKFKVYMKNVEYPKSK